MGNDNCCNRYDESTTKQKTKVQNLIVTDWANVSYGTEIDSFGSQIKNSMYTSKISPNSRFIGSQSLFNTNFSF